MGGRETGEAETTCGRARRRRCAMPLTEADEFYGTPRGGVANYVNGLRRPVIRLHPAVRRARRGRHINVPGPIPGVTL
jgi:hypothetical protein